MGIGNFCLLGTLAATLWTAADTGSYQKWVGVWQGELDGVPGVTVTLGTDNGSVEGTIVFNVVARDGGQARVIGRDAHALIRVRLEEDTLSFQVIRLRDGKDLHLTVRLTGEDSAVLECADCGGPPSVQLLRIR